MMDPFRDKLMHRAAKIRADGGVSALCYPRPRAIALSCATWTIRAEAVTCRKCLAIMAERTTGRKNKPVPNTIAGDGRR